MPITRTPILDDDGTGTTGTVIDHAWKEEFYDQIDELAAGAVTAIGAAQGATTSATAEVLSIIAVPPLTMQDYLVVSVVLTYSGGVSPVSVDLAGVDVPVGFAVMLALTGAAGMGDLTPNCLGVASVIIRPAPPGPSSVESLGHGIVTVGGTQGRGFVFGALSGPDLVTPPGVQLYLRQLGIAAGGSGHLSWSWSVHRVTGQAAASKPAPPDFGLGLPQPKE